jgi:hypothetical protein
MNKMASDWLDNNWQWLIKEYNNKWVSASPEGLVGFGITFDIALENTQARNISLSDVVFVYLTDDPIQ